MTTHTAPPAPTSPTERGSTQPPRRERNTESYRSQRRAPRRWMQRIDAAGSTSAGKKRNHNEDNFVVAELGRCFSIAGTSLDEPSFEEPTQAVVLAVADGIGGHGDGDAASAAALESAVRYIFDRAPATSADGTLVGSEDQLTCVLEAAFSHAQSRMLDLAQRRGLDPKLGTTLTLAYLVARRAYICHVGDSRAYRSRAGQLEQLTTDHTVAEKLRAHERERQREQSSNAGPFGRDERPTGLLRRFEHVLANAVGGGDRSLQVELHRCSLQPGDSLLLCSDGLTKHVDDSGLHRALVDDSLDARGATDVLISAANAGGGSDNITAVVAKVR